MPHVLKVVAIKLGAPVTLVIGLKSYDLTFHKVPQEIAKRGS
jgi:hypothetical protein